MAIAPSPVFLLSCVRPVALAWLPALVLFLIPTPSAAQHSRIGRRVGAIRDGVTIATGAAVSRPVWWRCGLDGSDAHPRSVGRWRHCHQPLRSPNDPGGGGAEFPSGSGIRRRFGEAYVFPERRAHGTHRVERPQYRLLPPVSARVIGGARDRHICCLLRTAKSTQVTIEQTYKDLPDFSLSELFEPDFGQVVPPDRDLPVDVERYSQVRNHGETQPAVVVANAG